MSTYYQDLVAFHNKYDIMYDGRPRLLPRDLRTFRSTFLEEELSEYLTAVSHAEIAVHKGEDPAIHLADALDALVDLVYVAIGTAVFHGFDFPEAWRRVHHANMTMKRRANDAGESKRASAYDVVKLPTFTPPDHLDLVSDHAHKTTVDT